MNYNEYVRRRIESGVDDDELEADKPRYSLRRDILACLALAIVLGLCIWAMWIPE